MKVRNWTGMVLAGVIAAGTLCCGFGTDFVYAASENVEINTTNFPNAKFRKYIKDNLDKNKDDNLSGESIIIVDTLRDAFCKYQNHNVKHDDNVKEQEINFILELQVS